MSDDGVNHPSHYNESSAKCSSCGAKIECIDVVRHFNFNLGNVIKYIWRAGKKNQESTIKDLKKAQFYLNDEISTGNIESEDYANRLREREKFWSHTCKDGNERLVAHGVDCFQCGLKE